MIRIGKNAQNNWEIFDESLEHYTLFHLDSFPSCYVIIDKAIDDLSIDEIDTCSMLCKENTKYRKMTVKVFYTSISNLTKGEKVGEIIITRNKLVRYYVK